jgi:lysylphosphatidylglycerol synthetase-like protein (DUF2156 family)
LPFQGHVWSLYAGACAGYTVLVFGLRRIKSSSPTAQNAADKSISSIFLTHISFLTIVVAWVWLVLFVKPHLPYILSTEDSSHPYFWLAFLGILGLLLIEAIEQRRLAPEATNNSANTETKALQ